MKTFTTFIKKLASYILIFLFFQGILWGYLPEDMSSFETNVVLAKGENGKIRPGIKTRSGSNLKALSKNILEDTIISVNAEIASGTVVSERGGDLQAIENFISNPSSVIDLKNEVLRLGYTDKYLTFSKPVKLTFTTQYKKGKKVRPLVQHYGDDKYNTKGLTTNPNAICNDGIAVNETFDTVTIGSKGIAEFYTCGASSFTMNPVGGTTTSNDLKLIIGDCGQIQVWQKGVANIYSGNPPATGCSGSPSSWLRLRVGTTDIGNAGSTAWTTMGTTGSTNGNTYTATSSLSTVVGGRTYNLNLYRNYTAPNSYFNWSYSLNIPSGNPSNVKLYFAADSYVGGADAGDVGYYSTTPTVTAGVYDTGSSTMLSLRYLGGRAWAGYQSAGYSTISSIIKAGNNFNNTTTSTPGDLGFGVNWEFGTGSTGVYTGSSEIRMQPYVAGSVPDLIASVGQPVPNLQVNTLSQIPVIVSNVGNTGSTGNHTIKFTLPTQITGPSVPFASNGWACGSAVSRVVTCTNTGLSIPALGTGGVNIPVIPQASASGLTLPFTGSTINASDSNNTNNTGVTNLYIAVAPAPIDTTPPTVSFSTPFSGSIRPIGSFVMNVAYSDTGTAMNLSSDQVILKKWSGSTWGGNIATGVVDFSGEVLTNTGGSYTLSGLTYGKYQVTYSIKDMAGNTGTGISIFYIDEPEIVISTGSLSMGIIPYNVTTSSVGDITVTIKTVGAGIDLTLNQNTEFSEISGQPFLRWDGSQGFGYQVAPYTGSVLSIGTGGNLVLSQAQNINTNGLKNTYTFTFKPSVKFIDQWLQVAGDYSAQIGFTTQFNY